MTYKFSRRQIIKAAGGFVAGAASIPLLNKLTNGSDISPAQAQSNTRNIIASIDESAVRRTLYASPNGNDGNSGGTESTPVTLTKAISLIGTQNTRIILLDGDYRGSYTLDPCAVRGCGESTVASNIVIFQAKNAGKAVITGSDQYYYDSSKPDISRISSEGAGKFSLLWQPQRIWGLGGEIYNFDTKTTDYNRRREMVFVNGKRLEQVLSYNELSPSTFYVDEGENKIIFQPPVGVTLSSKTRVEVSVRGSDSDPDRLFSVVGQSNLVFRGLVFQHAASYGNAALRFWSHVGGPPDPDRFPSNILIDNCKFRQNNYEGLSLLFVKNFTVKNSVFDQNGVTGASGGHWFDGEWLDCQFTNNNWRGGQWLAGHHAAGCKTFDGNVGTNEVQQVSSGVQFLRCRFTDNKALGFWQDYSGDNFTMERCLIENNISGMMREKTYGTFILSNSVIRNNFNENVTLYASPETTLDNCYIYGAKLKPGSNPQGVKQFYLVADARTNGGEQGSLANTKIKNCTIQANVSGTKLFDVQVFTDFGQINFDIRASFLNTLTSDHNRWWSTDGSVAFLSYELSNIDFAAWQSLTPPSGRSLDANSKWEQADFSAVPDPTLQFPNGLYRVSPGHASSKVLDVLNFWTGDEANIQQWEWGGGNNQRWQVEHIDSGYYRLIAWHSSKAADVQFAGSAEGTNVWQYGWNGGDAQLWLIESLIGDYYKLTPRCAPGKVLSVVNDPNDGANVEIQTWNGANRQQWQFLNP